MAFYIKSKQDNRTVHAVLQNVADIPGGVTINTEDLIAGTVLADGVALGKDANGVYHVVKTAKVYEAADNAATAYKVEKGNQFKVGDILSLGKAKVGKAITSIDRDTSAIYDEITVGATLGTGVTVGQVLIQANAAASSSVFKYTPVAITADAYDIKAGESLWAPAVVIGTVKSDVAAPANDDVKNALKGIIYL